MTEQRSPAPKAADRPPQIVLRCPFCLEVGAVNVRDQGEEGRPACPSCEKPFLLDRPAKVNAEDFDATVLGADVPVLVDFYAEWCGPCKVMAPMLDELARDWTGRVLFAKVDTDRAPDVAARYEIRSVPTVIMFADGNELGRSLGIMMDEIRGLLDRATG